MKKMLLLVAISVAFTACKEEPPKDYVTFSGKITNKNSDTIKITSKGYSKTIAVNEDGSFSDTLKLERGLYSFYDGTEGTSLFLENGYELTMTLDTEEFDETIKYEGIGAGNNNYLAEQTLVQEKLFDADYDGMKTEAELSAALDKAAAEYTEFINAAADIDNMITNSSRERLDGMINSYKRYYGGIIALRNEFPAGSPSPTFVGYENYKGGTTSLADLKGKYVYVDVWATWCGPCKAEIPSLKKVEADFHDKNIAFVSMSIDDDRRHKGSWDKAKESWRNMIADKQLGGIQIFAPNGWESDFIKGYKINGIPRFILIDPDGNVVDPNAPRPSNPKLKEMLENLI